MSTTMFLTYQDDWLAWQVTQAGEELGAGVIRPNQDHPDLAYASILTQLFALRSFPPGRVYFWGAGELTHRVKKLCQDCGVEFHAGDYVFVDGVVKMRRRLALALLLAILAGPLVFGIVFALAYCW